MRTRHNQRSNAMLAFGAVVGLVAAQAGCGPDPDKITRDVKHSIQQDLDQRVRAEVDRRLRAELPRLEARLRAQLTGQRLAPVDPMAPVAPRPAEPVGPARPGPQADAGVAAPVKPADPALSAEPKPDPKGLTLKRQLIVKEIKDRKPVGAATSFTVADGQVYCYLDAVNPKGPERHLSVAWIHNGKPFHKVRLRVGVGHVWRTWARLRLRPQSVGSWHCTVSNEEGQLLARAAFTVQPGPAQP